MADVSLVDTLDRVFDDIDALLSQQEASLDLQEIGTLTSVGQGIARAAGLPGVQAEELVRLPGDRLAMAFNLDPDSVGLILLDEGEGLRAGTEVRRTGRVTDVPVGEALLGRVVDALGRPLDDGGPVQTRHRQPVERPAPAIMDRSPVETPLQTGIKAVDALVPIGRGQRELILGDRQVGKTAIALDTIVNQRETGVICIYCAIGQRNTAAAKTIAALRQHEALAYSVVVVATGEEPPGLQFIAPYAATTMAEFFMEQGRDVLIVYDDLTAHARAYREVSLLLRRPPGREAYPGDIFYIHSRLLERSTHLREGGTLTALPIIEVQAQNISAYIPTNLISITDGQIYLTPKLFRKGILPAIDVGRSVSRVGGDAQLDAYQAVAGDLRLTYSQFEELEAFSRFGTRLEEETRRTLERGRRVREVLKQPQYEPLPVAEQIAILLAVVEGLLDDLPVEQVEAAEGKIREAMRGHRLYEPIQQGAELDEDDRAALRHMIGEALDEVRQASKAR